MKIKILGKLWDLRFVHNLTNRGDCDSPIKPFKEIRVSSALKGEEKLEVLLHEMFHAACWNLDEEFVEEFAVDVARNLWRLGYRQTDQTGKDKS